MDPNTEIELATAVRDLAGVVGELCAKVDESNRLAALAASSAPDVKLYFETQNREHAQVKAEAAEAGNRKRATLDEWLSWLTPKRAVALIAALTGLCGFGGPMTGLAGKVQAAYEGATNALLSESP